MRRYRCGLGTAALAAVLLLMPRPAWCARLAVGSNYNCSVLRYQTPTGIYLDTMVPNGGGGLCNPLGMTLGPDGHLYVAGASTSKIHRFDRETGESLGDFATGVITPSDIAFGPDGHLYVVNQQNHRIDRFNGATGAAMGAFTSGNLTYPKGLAFSPDGQFMLVTEAQNDRVVRFSATTGAFHSVAVPTGTPGLDNPYDVEYGPDGHLYVSSTNTSRVLCFNGSTGALIRSFILVGSYRVPLGIGFDHDGSLYVCDWGSNNIQRFNSATGQHLGVIQPNGGLDHPYFLCFLPPAAPGSPAAQVVVNSPAPGQRRAPGIQLTWGDSGNDEDGYVIERRQGEGEFAPVAAVGADTLAYTDFAVLPEVAYTYRVQAQNDLGDSLYSPTATATVYPEVSLVVPSSLFFPNTLIGQTSAKSVSLRNPTTKRVVGTLSFTSGPFSLPVSDQSFSLGPGETKVVTATFAPTHPGTFPSFLRAVVGNAPPKTIDISVKGVGVAPVTSQPVRRPSKISLSTATALKFAGIYAGEATGRVLKLKNAGKVPLTVEVTVIDGPLSVGADDQSFTMEPVTTRLVTIFATPAAAGKFTGTVRLTVGTPGEETTKIYTVKVTGSAKPARATAP